jgi:Type I phosphodiesterase / nucleotide pyrophosphatase
VSEASPGSTLRGPVAPDAPATPGPVRGTLAEVLPSAAAALGVPGYRDTLGLATTDGRQVRKVVVLLVDGLGWNLLRANAAAAPFLSGLADAGGRDIATGFPSTTATSMASFGTGATPGRHGLVGYTFALPGQEGLLNALRWNSSADPLDVQPVPTVFERVADDGVDTAHVALRSFDGSGLTRAALRGARSPGADTMGEAVQATAESMAHGGRALVYVYTGDLDNVGHVRGCGSSGWLSQLEHVDLLVRHLIRTLPPDGLLVVTADHGMVDVGPGDRFDFDHDPLLSAGVLALGGEPRARHVYARPGAAGDVLSAWRERLGSAAVVISRDEAVDGGWFGPQVSPAVLPRIGDVVVAPTGGTAVVSSRAHPREARLVGYHGSTTDDEVLVPLVVAGGSISR